MANLIESLRQLVSRYKLAIAVIVGAAALVPIGIFVRPELGPALGEI